ncbi:MAG: DUF2203 domain-containing protein [Bdellovibrionales bacterium]|nr:DUF2203 domain-containing protein [Bdellovibrionales bacterium]
MKESVNYNNKNGQVTDIVYNKEEADKVLPLIKSIVRDIVEDFVKLREAGKTKRKVELIEGKRFESSVLNKLNEDIQNLSNKIEAYINELSQFNISVRDIELGIVDFPGLKDGESIFLSWKLGELEVLWWHPVDKCFSDRMLISVPTLD